MVFKFGIVECKPIGDECGSVIHDLLEYHWMIGSLIYLAMTQLGLRCKVNLLTTSCYFWQILCDVRKDHAKLLVWYMNNTSVGDGCLGPIDN